MSAARPAERRASRDAGVDAVRGVALLSMFVAHSTPTGEGLLGSLSDFLTAALFATLVGVGLGLRDRRGGLAAALVRGAVLVLVGLMLEQAGAQVNIILVHLGLLTWVVALLRPLPSWALAGVAVWLALVSPTLRDAWLGVQAELVSGGHAWLARTVEIVFTGAFYRLTALAVWALVGVLLARHLLRRRRGPGTTRPVLAGLAALLGATTVYLGAGGTLRHSGVVPYSGTVSEIVFDGLLATVVLLVGVVTTDRARAGAGWLAAMGRMSLTLYTLHVLWLALLNRAVFHGRTDDGWPTLLSLVVGSVALAWVWNRRVRRGVWTRGPLEGLSDLLVRRTTGRRSRADVPTPG